MNALSPEATSITADAVVADFTREYFSYTRGRVYVGAIRNHGSKLPIGEIDKLVTRSPRAIAEFARKNDDPKKDCAVYFCTSTLKSGATRRKADNCWEFPSLIADCDDKDHYLTRAEAVLRLEGLECPPTYIIDSGHGLQAHWLLAEPSEHAKRVIAARKKLHALVASDPVYNADRFMRLPGSHNSKRGDWLPVGIVSHHKERRYDLEVLEEWVDRAEIVIPRKPKTNGDGTTNSISTPFVLPPSIKAPGSDKRGAAWAQKALEASANELANAGVGERHNVLVAKSFRMATMIARGWIDVSSVRRALFAASQACGQIKDDGIGHFDQAFGDMMRKGLGLPHGDLPDDDHTRHAPPLADPEGVSDVGAHAKGGAPDSEPIPLYPPLPPAKPFPLHALGPILAAAAAAIASKVQLPDAIAAQSVLAVATLAAQAHANVRLPFGQVRPLSLFFLTIALSGDRKTSADKEALWPVRKRESVLRSIHQNETENWKASHASWHAEKKKLEANSKLDYESRKQALMLLGSEPERPLHPIITAADPTIEGLIKTWVNAPASLGLFTPEGGQFLGGYGMAQDQRLKTAAALSSLWDGDVVKRVRAGEDLIQLPGRRFSLHLMVQPHIAQNFLADPVLRDQGLLSRILVTAAESIAGTRFYRDPLPQDDRAIVKFGARLLELLEKPFPLAAGQRNELEPPVIELDPDANQKWRLAYDRIEGRQGPGKDLREIRDFASKAAEQAARMAAVIALVANPDTLTIDGNTMANGIILIDWYLAETARLQQASRTDPRLKIAQELLEWLQARGTQTTFRQIYQFGPTAVRTKQTADPIIQILKEHGWIRQVAARPLTFAVAT